MKKSFLALFLALVFVLTGCASQTIHEDGTLPLLDMPYALANASRVTVSEFDFGEGDLRNSLGTPVPCPLDGIIAAPDGPGPYPLVVVLHGLRNVTSVYDPVYIGFDYLVQQLAAEGYVAIAFNVNIDYHCWDFGESSNYDWAYQVYEQQLALLERANAGSETGHGVDLQGKIDLDQIHLIGHSRGGEMADMFYRRDHDAGHDRTRSIIGLAPGMLAELEPHPDIPTGIILGELDGDTSEAGQLLYDYIRKQPERTAPVSFTYIRGANHAFFNRTFLWDDARSEVDRLTREQQEDFTMRYTAAFLSVFAKGKEPFGTWDTNEPQPVTMFGYPVTASSFVPGSRLLLAPSEKGLKDISTAGDVEIRYLLKTWLDDVLFNHPGANMNDRELPLYSIRWTDKNGGVKLPAGDFSGFTALTLYIAVDSSDSLNADGEDQSLTITISDKSGAAQSILIPKGTSALAWHDGNELTVELFEAPDLIVWEGFMPLVALRIPLRLFDEIDLSSVSEITLDLDQTDSGAIMLSEIYLEA